MAIRKYDLRIGQLPVRIGEVEKELEYLRTDPATNHEEIASLELTLSRLRGQYNSRKAKIKGVE